MAPGPRQVVGPRDRLPLRRLGDERRAPDPVPGRGGRAHHRGLRPGRLGGAASTTRPIPSSPRCGRWTRAGQHRGAAAGGCRRAWRREGRHTESGRYTAEDWLLVYSEHLEKHDAQIERNLAAWRPPRQELTLRAGGSRSAACLAGLVLLAAVLYSSVGHGGASAYLAAMALFGIAPDVMKPAALVMNVAVALVGTTRFARAGLVPTRLLLPLLLGSIPAAFVGGLAQLPTAAHRVCWPGADPGGGPGWPGPAKAIARCVRPRRLVARGPGAVLGLVEWADGSGGIFPSPCWATGWERVRQTPARRRLILATPFGLLGHLGAGRPIPAGVGLLSLVAVAGGLYGSWLGVRRLSTLALRRLLAVVLVVAGVKLLLP